GEAARRERMRPGPPTVRRTVDAARVARAEEVADRRDDDIVGIGRADPDPSDVAGVVKAEIGPRLAAVDALVDAAAGLDVVARLGLPAADIDDVWIGRGDGDGADGRAAALIEHGCPGVPGIVGAPDAAARRAE